MLKLAILTSLTFDYSYFATISSIPLESIIVPLLDGLLNSICTVLYSS